MNHFEQMAIIPTPLPHRSKIEMFIVKVKCHVYKAGSQQMLNSNQMPGCGLTTKVMYMGKGVKDRRNTKIVASHQ